MKPLAFFALRRAAALALCCALSAQVATATTKRPAAALASAKTTTVTRFTRAAAPILAAAYTALRAPASLTAALTGVADTLTLSGANFVPASKAYLGGMPLETFFINANTLKVYIPPSLVQEGEYDVTVVNPAYGGGTTSSQKLTIVSPANNPLAMEFAHTTKQTSYHELDSSQNSNAGADSVYLSIRAMPRMKQYRTEGKIFLNGTSITTITDLTVAGSVGTREYYTALEMDAANRQGKITVIDATVTPAAVKFYRADGTLLHVTQATVASWKPLIDSIKQSPNPCGQLSGSILNANLNANLPQQPSSMQQLIAKAQAMGGTVETLSASLGVYKVVLNAPAYLYGLPAPSSRKIALKVNTLENYIAMTELYDGSKLLNRTYYRPKATGACAAVYDLTVSENFYRTANNTAMKGIIETEYSQINTATYLQP